jgi:hypothetical protein
MYCMTNDLRVGNELTRATTEIVLPFLGEFTSEQELHNINLIRFGYIARLYPNGEEGAFSSCK